MSEWEEHLARLQTAAMNGERIVIQMPRMYGRDRFMETLTQAIIDDESQRGDDAQTEAE